MLCHQQGANLHHSEVQLLLIFLPLSITMVVQEEVDNDNRIHVQYSKATHAGGNRFKS